MAMNDSGFKQQYENMSDLFFGQPSICFRVHQRAHIDLLSIYVNRGIKSCMTDLKSDVDADNLFKKVVGMCLCCHQELFFMCLLFYQRLGWAPKLTQV